MCVCVSVCLCARKLDSYNPLVTQSCLLSSPINKPASERQQLQVVVAKVNLRVACKLVQIVATTSVYFRCWFALSFQWLTRAHCSVLLSRNRRLQLLRLLSLSLSLSLPLVRKEASTTRTRALNPILVPLACLNSFASEPMESGTRMPHNPRTCPS